MIQRFISTNMQLLALIFSMKGVTYLTGTTFADHMAKNPTTMVMYYAPWCPHCVEAKPKIQAANEQLKAKKAAAGLAAMNCDLKENEGELERFFVV